MTKIVNVHDAKTHLSKLLDRVQAGEEIVLAKAGVPYARLVPVKTDASPRRPGRFKGLFTLDEALFEPLPAEELAAWEGGPRPKAD